MSKTEIPGTSHSCAGAIVDAFFRNGGFSREAALKMSLEAFRNLPRDFATLASEDSWQEYQDALALWALICVEINACEDDLNALKDAFDRTTDADLAYGDPDHRTWFGQLAFNLFSYKWRKERDRNSLVWLRSGLWETLKKATLANLHHRVDRNHLITSWLTPETLKELWGQWDTGSTEEFAPKVFFKQTRKALESTARLGCDEAFLFLAMLRFCDDSSGAQYLENASRSKWNETRQLASFLKAMSHREPNSRKAALCNLRFPVEIDEDDRELDPEDYLFLGLVATRADLERKAKQRSPAGFNRQARWCILESFLKTNIKNIPATPTWTGRSKIMRERWETAELRGVRLLEELERPDQAELKVETISALLATTRLIESFLRTCFITWPLDKHLHKSDVFFEEKKSWLEIDNFAGARLGHGANHIKISELMDSAGIWFGGGRDQPRPGFFELFRGLNQLGPAREAKIELPELIGANSLAAATNQDHIFRRAPAEELRRAVCVFAATYNIRNKYDGAHAAPQRAEAEEVIFWSKLVRSEISNLLKYPNVDLSH